MAYELDPGQYRLILESLPDGVYAVDADRRIIFWNDGAEKITGYLRHQVIGRLCCDNLLMHCDENERVLCEWGCPLLATIRDGHPRDSHLFLRHNDGERVPVWVQDIAVRDRGGRIIGAAESFYIRKHEMEREPRANAAPGAPSPYNGVSDHDEMESFLRTSLQDVASHCVPFGVLIIGIDAMPHFLKTHGSEAAHKMLATVAATLARGLREGDLIGYWEEDRFLAILLDCSAAALACVAWRLKKIAGAVGIPWWGDRLSVTVSVGGTLAGRLDTAQSVLERVQQAWQSTGSKGSCGVEIV